MLGGFFGFSGSGAGGGGVSGNGTLNYLAKWTPNGTTLGNSIVYSDETGVGIGTNAINYLLNIGPAGDIGFESASGFIRFAGNARFGSVAGNSQYYTSVFSSATGEGIYLKNYDGTVNIMTIKDNGLSEGQVAVGYNVAPVAGSLFYLKSSSGAAFRIDGSLLNNILYVENAGNVGIGTNSPSQKLDVYGSINLTYDGSGFSKLLTQDAFVDLYMGLTAVGKTASISSVWSANSNVFPSKISLGKTEGPGTINGKIELTVDSNTSGSKITMGQFFSGVPRAIFINTDSNYIGINYDTPSANLHVKSSSGTALRVDGSLLSNNFFVNNDGKIGMPNIQVGNAGLSSGDLYVDTAANVLANGDYVVARKV